MEPVSTEATLDETLRSAAELDLARALILQNARTARRWDVLGAHRTAKNERRLRVLGLSLTLVGGALSLLLALSSSLRLGQPAPSHLALLVTFAVLSIVFWRLPRLRAAGVRRLDAVLRGRARRILARARPDDRLRYTLSDHSLRCESVATETPKLRYERSTSQLRYALAGETSLILFASKRSQNPTSVVLCSASELQRALIALGVELEHLSKDLLPPSTLERPW